MTEHVFKGFHVLRRISNKRTFRKTGHIDLDIPA
jgi:hypothetical protein